MENDLSRDGSAVLPLQELSVPTETARENETSLADDLASPRARARARLRLQRFIGHLVLIPFGGLLIFLMRYVRGYRIERMAEIRREFEILSRDPVPTMICANHLTFIDSALIIWALGATPWYSRKFRCFSWNLPAGDFFKKKLVFLIVAYLSKCIFIHRDGSKEHKNSILGICRHLLEKGEIVSIFPEGRRSRIGTFDREHLTYGVGKIIAGMKECRVICVYLRADKQETYTNYPPKNSNFKILIETIYPKTSHVGKSAYGEIVGQVGDTLAALEKKYFAERKPSPHA